jgi:hypothetical protein
VVGPRRRFLSRFRVHPASSGPSESNVSCQPGQGVRAQGARVRAQVARVHAQGVRALGAGFYPGAGLLLGRGPSMCCLVPFCLFPPCACLPCAIACYVRACALCLFALRECVLCACLSCACLYVAQGTGTTLQVPTPNSRVRYRETHVQLQVRQVNQKYGTFDHRLIKKYHLPFIGIYPCIAGMPGKSKVTYL